MCHAEMGSIYDPRFLLKLSYSVTWSFHLVDLLSPGLVGVVVVGN